MAGSLDNKIALVTGGSSGIGRAAALTFAREGAKVIVSDVSTGGGEETAGLVEERGGEAVFVPADVSKIADVKFLIDKTVETHGRLDCAYNNAGIWGVTMSTVDYPESEWDHVIDVNLKGVWLCMKYEILQMLKQGGGTIVNTSSGAGLVGSPQGSAYVASKHGVVGLTKTGAIEYAKAGIRINAVCPGIVRTPMIELIMASRGVNERDYVAREPIGRMSSPEEVAEAAVWLCSDAASFVTGHAMAVDGGEMAV